MALRRMVPVTFFTDPDIMALSHRDMQLILLGLILAADDEGRAVAHASLLGREMDFPAEQIEAALQELVTNDLLVLYQAGRHRYYQLVRWDQWQTLGNKKTPSKLPAPPLSVKAEVDGQTTPVAKPAAGSRKFSEKIRGTSEFSGKSSSQLNQIESNLIEDEGEQQSEATGKVLPFPKPPTSADSDDNRYDEKAQSEPTTETRALVEPVARILQLPVTDALTRLVVEYACIPGLSLSGEADAAREWIGDTRRNKQHKRMSPAFFRGWLKRETEALERRRVLLEQAATTQATGTTGAPSSAPEPQRRPPSLMHLADEDQRAKGAKHS